MAGGSRSEPHVVTSLPTIALRGSQAPLRYMLRGMDGTSHAEPPKPFWKANDRGTVLSIHLTPRSSRSQVIGNVDGWLKVKVTAPPTDDEANDALLKFLARDSELRPRSSRSSRATSRGTKRSSSLTRTSTRNSCSANGSLEITGSIPSHQSATAPTIGPTASSRCHRRPRASKHSRAQRPRTRFRGRHRQRHTVSDWRRAFRRRPTSDPRRCRAPLALVYRGPAGCDDGCSEAAAAMLRSSRYHFARSDMSDPTRSARSCPVLSLGSRFMSSRR